MQKLTSQERKSSLNSKKVKKEEKKRKKFVIRIVNDAVLHLRKTYDETECRYTILKYSQESFEKIKENLDEINCIGSKYNVGIQVKSADLRPREVRFYYLKYLNPKTGL